MMCIPIDIRQDRKDGTCSASGPFCRGVQPLDDCRKEDWSGPVNHRFGYPIWATYTESACRKTNIAKLKILDDMVSMTLDTLRGENPVPPTLYKLNNGRVN